MKVSALSATLPAPSLADLSWLPKSKGRHCAGCGEATVAVNNHTGNHWLANIGIWVQVSIMTTSAVTPAPLNPVPVTVMLVPTAPFLVAGEVTTTFCSTSKLGVVALGTTVTPSVTVIR